MCVHVCARVCNSCDLGADCTFPGQVRDWCSSLRLCDVGVAQGLRYKVARFSKYLLHAHTKNDLPYLKIKFHEVSCVSSGNSTWVTWCTQASVPMLGSHA